jgi:hypothetical protein
LANAIFENRNSAVADCASPYSYRVAGLIDQHGRDATIVDWLEEIAADCPKRVENWNDQSDGKVIDWLEEIAAERICEVQ